MSSAPPTQSAYFVAGGTLSAEAGSYVERGADRALLSSLVGGKFCYVLNSRQMGKSSLCVRTMRRLEAEGIRTAFVDLTKIGGRNVTPEQWYAGITMEIGRALDLRAEMLAYWKENAHVSPVQRLFGSLRDVALAKLETPLVVFFDEIDATRSLSFSADEFFAAIRESYNRRVHDQALARLSFCLLGVAVPSDLINSPTSTPFNIGERIYLQDFTAEEASDLADGLTSPRHPRPNTQHLLQRILHWTHGHPYLTQSLCQAIAADPAVKTPEEVDALVKRDLFEPKARETNINLADVANRALHAGDLESDPEKFRADLLSMYSAAWKGKPVADDESNRVAALLKLSGIMRSEGNQLTVRNRIYERVFDQGWIRENMPGQELRRQKRSFWMGVSRTSAVGLLVLVLVALLGWTETVRRKEAQAAKVRAEHDLYISKMVNIELYDKEGNYRQIAQLLQETKDSPYRGWEWGYWNHILHDSEEEYAIRGVNDLRSMFSSDGRQILLWGAGKYALVERNDRRVIASGSFDNSLLEIKQLNGRFIVDAFDSLAVGMPIRDLLSPSLNSPEFIKPSPKEYVQAVADRQVLRRKWLTSAYTASENAIIDSQTGKVRFRLDAKDEYLEFSSIQSNLVAVRRQPSVGLDYKLRIYSALTNTMIREYEIPHGSGQNSVISLDGSACVVGDLDRLVLYGIKGAPKVVPIAIAGAGPLDVVCFLKGGQSILVQGRNHAYIVSLVTRLVERILSNCTTGSLSPSSQEIALGGATVRIKPVGKAELFSSQQSTVDDGLDSKGRAGDRYRWLSREFDIIDSGPTGLAAVLWPSRYQLFSDPELKTVGPTIRAPGKKWEPLYWNRNLWISQEFSSLEFLRTETGKIVSIQDFSPPAFSSARSEIVFCLDKTARKLNAWNRASGNQVWSVQLPDRAVFISGPFDGSAVVVCYSGTVETRNPVDGTLTCSRKLDRPNAFSMRDGYFYVSTGFTPSINFLGDTKKTIVCNGLDPAPVATLDVGSMGVDLSPDLNRAAASDRDSIMICERISGRRLLRIQLPFVLQGSLRFTSDGSKLLVGAAYRGIAILSADFHDPTTTFDVSDERAAKK